MQRQFLHVDSRTISYLDSAPQARDARVVLFVHAFPLAATMWEPQFQTVPDGWRFLAIDLRGFGGSTLGGDDESAASMDDYAADVIDLVGELQLPRVALAGLSMGGYVAFAVLRRRPELVEGVVLADTKAAADTPEGRAGRRGMMALVDREGPAAVAREMLPKLLAESTRNERAATVAMVRRVITGQSKEAIRGALRRMMDRPDATPQLAEVRVPALVIVGQDDGVTPPKDAATIADGIGGSELITLPGAGHLSNLEQPAAFTAALTAFLSRL